MNTTSVSLLERLKNPAEREAWNQFVRLYTPLLHHWAQRAGLSSNDAYDVVQEVFLLLMRKLPEFVYDGQRSFHSWLRTVLQNRLRELRRSKQPPPTAGSGSDWPDPTADACVDRLEVEEYRALLVHRALQLMQADFEPQTWRACWEFVVGGRRACEVAAELGVSVDVVYSAKSRVLRRLREELAGLWD